MDKAILLRQLKQIMSEEIQVATSAAGASMKGAVHEENRAEGVKDMRSTEASYLARGQSQRVADLEESLTKVSFMEMLTFGPDDPIGMSALVCLQGESQTRWLFIVPAGGGTKLNLNKISITTITPESPLGKELDGKLEGDDVDIMMAGKMCEYSIEKII